jgi:NitT/TauT family transport system substrate-binding protein
MDMYAHSIAAQDKTVQQRRKVTRSFIEATMKSIAWTVEKPDASLDLLLKRFATLKRKFARARWDYSVNSLMTPYSKANGIGKIDRKKMKKTVDIIKGAYNLKTGLNVDEVYTDEFVPRLFPKIPKS